MIVLLAATKYKNYKRITYKLVEFKKPSKDIKLTKKVGVVALVGWTLCDRTLSDSDVGCSEFSKDTTEPVLWRPLHSG